MMIFKTPNEFSTWRTSALKVQGHPVFKKDTSKQSIYSKVEFYEKDNELHEIKSYVQLESLKSQLKFKYQWF